ncbi:hypothetical protein DAEQUDRAFT_600500 [Daedalea quercina L-15889]|uniref:Uncharacterized protein n=1 Tax=Daedalea quercina L-15889 TaxID=1314783 RepID=A0A165LNY3_9APHY|nr:hypothetical protein DAEQUDRAFT_600500 [Daedalea quercina L-15889]
MLVEPDSLVEPMDGVEPLRTIIDPTPRVSPQSERNGQFRLSMERFNAFDSNISVLRHSDSPMPGPSLPRASRAPLETPLEPSSPALEMPPTPNPNAINRSRPSSPASPDAYISRLNAVAAALPPLPGWFPGFDGPLRPPLSDGSSLRFQEHAHSANRLRNSLHPRDLSPYGEPVQEARGPPRIQTFSERRREHPIGPEEALRRLREIQQSLEEYLQGTSTSLETASTTSPLSPNLTGLPSRVHTGPYRDLGHGSAETDPLTAELSLIRESIRRLQTRARQIEAIQRDRRDAGTGAAAAVRSAWVPLTGRPEVHSHTATDDGESSASRSTITDSRSNNTRLFGRDDGLYPLPFVAPNRRRRSIYGTRPGPSNSLMSENAAEFRSRRAREQLASLSTEPPRLEVSSDLQFSPVDWNLPGVGDRARSSPVDEPHFTPADWSLPAFRGSTRASEQDSTGARRSQPQRTRPTPIEPPIRSSFSDLLYPDFGHDTAVPVASTTRRARFAPDLDLSYLLNESPSEPRSQPFESPARNSSDPLPLGPRFPFAPHPDAFEQWVLGSPEPSLARPASQSDVLQPSAASARRNPPAPYADLADESSNVQADFRRRRLQREASLTMNSPRRPASDPSMDEAGLEVNSRRRLSRLMALRSMRGDTVSERDSVPPRSPTRATSPGAHVLQHDDDDPAPDNYDLNARADLRASLVPPRVFDSPPTPASRVAPTTSASRRQSTSRETSARTAPTSRFNLDSFHEGPFRATIQRSLEILQSSDSQRHGPGTSSRDPGAPSLPPLRFQRNPDERLPPLQSLSRPAPRLYEGSQPSGPSTAPYQLPNFLDGPSNRDWDFLLHRTMLRDQSSSESRGRAENANASENGSVCPVHGIVHGSADDILDHCEGDTNEREREGNTSLTRWMGATPKCPAALASFVPGQSI